MEIKLSVEQCDDGNFVSGDGCSTSWIIEPKYSWTGGTPTSKDTCVAIYGDGYKVSIEQWDDGNKVNGDGCSSTWMIESYFKWTGGTSSTKDTA